MRFRAAGVVFLLIALLAAPAPHAADALELVVCGWDEVFILRLGASSDAKPQGVWTWRAKGRADLPQEFHGLFNSTDECRPKARTGGPSGSTS